jgi:hypothetical protein
MQLDAHFKAAKAEFSHFGERIQAMRTNHGLAIVKKRQFSVGSCFRCRLP